MPDSTPGVQLIQSYPVLATVFTIAGTLIARWFWNRYLSVKDKISPADCRVAQEICRKELLNTLTNHGVDLDKGDERMEKMEKGISVIMITLLHICHELKINCDGLTKNMTDRGLID